MLFQRSGRVPRNCGEGCADLEILYPDRRGSARCARPPTGTTTRSLRKRASKCGSSSKPFCISTALICMALFHLGTILLRRLGIVWYILAAGMRLAEDDACTKVAHNLNERGSDLWDIDEDVQHWRGARAFEHFAICVRLTQAFQIFLDDPSGVACASR